MSAARRMQMGAAGVSAGGGVVEFVGYNDTNIQGSYTLDYPTGTQSGDLLFLFCGNDSNISSGTPSGWTLFVEGASPIAVFYRTASTETSVVAPAGTTPAIGGAIVVSFKSAAYVQSNTLDLYTGHTPPTSFTAFSGASVGNTCVCFVWYDDDVQSGDATQTDFSVAVSDFYGASAGAGCSMNVTYALGVVDSTTFTPPDLNASGIANENCFSWAFEIESTVTPAAPTWTDPDLANASYDSVSFSLAGLGLYISDVFFKPDGTKMYITVDGGGDDVKEYSLSSAWNVSTASYAQNFSLSSQISYPFGLFFKPDGSKMYVVDPSSENINEYGLSSAWDVSTASYTQNFSISTNITFGTGVFFKPDGEKLYIVDYVSKDINQYSLSTAWDISSASYIQNFSVASQEAGATSLFFSPNGDKMFITGQSGDDVNEYSLSSAWDISSASYVLNFSVSAQETSPNGIFFKDDGSKMYVVGSQSDTFYQYSTA